MQNLTEFPDRLLTRAEVEVFFGLTRRFLEVSAVNGHGPPMIRIRRSVKYRVCDLREWIEDRRVKSTSDTTLKTAANTEKYKDGFSDGILHVATQLEDSGLTSAATVAFAMAKSAPKTFPE